MGLFLMEKCRGGRICLHPLGRIAGLSKEQYSVGAGGFEPPASRTRTVRATGLRYAPKTFIIPKHTFIKKIDFSFPPANHF